MGCRFPGGANTPEEFWRLLTAGVNAITDIPRERFDVDAVYDPDPAKRGTMYTRRGGFADHVQDFDAAFFGISPREALRMDPQQRMLLEVSWEALEDAGIPVERLAGSSTGVFVGISTHDYSDVQVRHRELLDLHFGNGTALSIAANRISYVLDVRGPSFSVDTACSSSLVAIHLACQSLASGESDVSIAGGVNAFAAPESFIAFCQAGMLSPDGQCHTFDARANGYVRGEGAGVVVLKRLDDAVAAGDRIYAVILGSATNQDGRTASLNVPNGYAQEALMRTALATAGVKGGAIQYVEAHGTGTRVGDPIELSALGHVMGEGRASGSVCLLGSVKTNIGHLEAAAGVAGLIKTALALHHGAIPASLNFDSASRPVALRDLRLQVATALQPWPIDAQRRLAGVNSFGFGGANAHVVLEGPPVAESGPAPADAVRAHVLPVSARHPEALRELLQGYRTVLASGAAVGDVCYTAAARRSHHPLRVGVTGSSADELIEQIDVLLASGGPAPMQRHAGGGALPKVAFVFTGMGLQWWGMGRQLLATEPVFRAAIEQCDAWLHPVAHWSLVEALQADEHQSRVGHAAVAPVVNLAVQMALVRLWATWGIVPDAVVGHSAGEIAAAWAAGALTLEDALLVAFERGRLQQRASGTGTMLNAGIPAAEAAELVAAHAALATIATIDSPASTTLAGERAALDQIAAELTRRERFNRFVAVDVPYHGPQMDGIRDELYAALAAVAHAVPAIPLVSTVSGTRVGAIPAGGGHWFDNVRQPVRFAAAIDHLIDEQVEIFVEIGPHPALRRSIGECLASRQAAGTVLTTLRRHGDDRALMLRTLADLYTAGRAVHWAALYPSGVLVDAPRYAWQRERYWFDVAEAHSPRAGADSGHPLLGYRVGAARPLWEADLADPRLDYLEQHVVEHSPIVPGAAYAEMAVAAGRRLEPAGIAVVEDLAFHKALFLARRSGQVVQLLVAHDGAAFEVFSGRPAGDHAPWTRHASGKLKTLPAGSPSPPATDMAAVRARCPEHVPAADIYQALARRGLEYGPEFQGIAELWRGSGAAIARISPPATGGSDGAYELHPALLDAAFQVLFAAAEGRQGVTAGGRYLPAAVRRLTLVRSPGPSVWAHAVVTRINGDIVEGNITVSDEAGNVAVAIESLRCHALGQAGRALEHTWDDVLYQLRWEPSPLPATSGHRPAAVASAVGIAPLLGAEVARRTAQPGWAERHAGPERILNAIAVHYARAALLALGWDGVQPGDERDALALRLGVVPRHQRLFGRLLEMAAETPAPEPAAGPDAGAGELLSATHLCGELLRARPHDAAAVELLRRSGERLSAILTGAADARDVLLAAGANDAWARFFGEVPSYQFYNTLVADAVALALAGGASDAPVRLLEIGAGTGGTTASVLPRLGARPAEYHFTDVSPLFLAQAGERFRDQPVVRVASLDIEREPHAQLGPHTFDVILAANVLHATSDLRATLRHIQSLLAPGGLLVLLEASRKTPWFDVIFGITDGWWRFTDTDLRPAHPLMDAGRWCALLTDAGFEHAASASEATGGDLPMSAVILATAPRSSPLRSAVAPGAGRRDWLLYDDEGGAGARVAEHLRGRGDRCVRVRRDAGYRRLETDLFAIAPVAGDTRQMLDALSVEGFAHHGLIHLWALDAPGPAGLTAPDLLDAQQWICGSVTSLVQAYDAVGRPLPDTWLLTEGAQPGLPGDGESGLVQSPLWGIGRVLSSERTGTRCRLVDLDPRAPDGGLWMLLQELGAEAPALDEEVAYRDGTRLVTRLRRANVRELRSAAPALPASPEADGFALQIDEPGALEQLVLRHVATARPGPGEVRIRVLAVGLNFRDVMLALGLLPPVVVPGTGAPGLGFECAGVVVECGDGVQQFREGDAVMALAFGACATHVVARAEQVVAKPAAMSFEEAASIPIAFATAYHSLVQLARLDKGERVLIHAATGGVGLAALQVARLVGAEIFATAGSPAKRDYLRTLGVAHAMDSRSLGFADEVMALTRGEGVDVVLNSLAGEAIAKGLSILRPYGRFIELGKRDIHGDSPLGLQPFDRSLSFVSVALDQMFKDRSAVLGGILREVVALMDAGTFQPLPHRTYDLAEAEAAFRVLAQAAHMGKLVLTVKAQQYPVAPARNAAVCRADGTYIISGGLGGFGLAVAQWLADGGARHLVLISRRGAPAAGNLRAFDALLQSGAQVVVHRGDVASASDIAGLRDRIGAMPPVRGIVHAAMVLDDALLMQLTPERLDAVLAPKVAGAWNLHQLTAGDRLDFFVMFSSLASVIGTAGQGSYAAANTFLGAFARYRRGLGLPALTIDWGGLSDVGYVADHPDLAEHLRRHGTDAFTSREAVQVLEEALRAGVTQLVAARVDWDRWSAMDAQTFKHSARLATLTSARVPNPGVTAAASLLPVLAAAPPESRATLVEAHVAERVAKVLGTSRAKVPADTPLASLGLDSLMAVELRTMLERDSGVPVPLEWLLDGISLQQLAARLCDRLAEALPAAGDKTGAGTPPAAGAAAVAAPETGTVDSADAAPPNRPPESEPAPEVVAPPPAAESSARPLSEPSAQRIDYRALDYRRWTPTQTVARTGIAALFRIAAGPIDVDGLERIPASGPVVLAMNHLSMLDVPLMFTLLPRPAICLAGDHLQQVAFARRFLDLGRSIYVRRGEADREALASAAAVLAAGGILAIAPEGTRSRSGRLGRGHVGMIRLAAAAGAPVVPIAACGHEHIPGNLRRLRRSRVQVRIGEPLTVQRVDTTAVALQAETDRIMRAIAAMLPAAYRGVYADPAP